MNETAQCFPPIADARARVLILGSMPGVRSLAEVEYYAHPRNAFWRIMAELFGAGREVPYEDRCRRLRGAGVAVWDVLAECRRAGSLDASIERGTERVNDFVGLFAQFHRIERVFCNGQKAYDTFRRRAAPTLSEEVLNRITVERLPSTSPAHAGRSFEEKLSAWRVVADAVGD